MIRNFALGAAALLCAASVSLATPQDKPAAKGPTLKVGDPAPVVKVEKWLKGTPVAGFEKGKVYVLEFWATWCGPCIASMPHISMLQREYQGKVTIIGTNIWEDKEYGEGTLPKVEKFLAERGDRMAYTVAYDGPAKAMDTNYMRAAGRNGIPSAFIVDQKGTIAWMGHPAGMDFALHEIVEGKWDATTGPEREKKVMEQLKSINGKLKSDPAGAQAEFDKLDKEYPFMTKHQDDLRLALLMAGGKWDQAYVILGKKADEAIAAKDADALNEIAWNIVDPEAKIEKRDLELALRAAQKGVEFTAEKDAGILDTLARVWAWKGDYKKALEIETKAAALGDRRYQEGIDKALAEYKEKAK